MEPLYLWERGRGEGCTFTCATALLFTCSRAEGARERGSGEGRAAAWKCARGACGHAPLVETDDKDGHHRSGANQPPPPAGVAHAVDALWHPARRHVVAQRRKAGASASVRPAVIPAQVDKAVPDVLEHFENSQRRLVLAVAIGTISVSVPVAAPFRRCREPAGSASRPSSARAGRRVSCMPRRRGREASWTSRRTRDKTSAPSAAPIAPPSRARSRPRRRPSFRGRPRPSTALSSNRPRRCLICPPFGRNPPFTPGRLPARRGWRRRLSRVQGLSGTHADTLNRPCKTRARTPPMQATHARLLPQRLMGYRITAPLLNRKSLLPPPAVCDRILWRLYHAPDKSLRCATGALPASADFGRTLLRPSPAPPDRRVERRGAIYCARKRLLPRHSFVICKQPSQPPRRSPTLCRTRSCFSMCPSARAAPPHSRARCSASRSLYNYSYPARRLRRCIAQS